MANHPHHDNATSNILAWSAHGANVEPAVEEDAGADADEPPDERKRVPVLAANGFRKTPVSRQNSHHESLLTRALHSHSEEEPLDHHALLASRRRRSLTSNVSIASTADHTSDTGITTPARTSSPSPRVSIVGFTPLVVAQTSLKTPSASSDSKETTPGQPISPPASSTGELTKPAVPAERKRCISFACAATPKDKDAAAMPPPPKPKIVEPKPAPQAAPKRPCIKFACPSRPAAPKTPPQREAPTPKSTARKT